ncbi:hypothetical protein F4809DRAFT_634087 [Biscogniauxia mediterranea]|nr:hypothetical protein F4809DRAFT_634087 [Biscogniauxia mediterranea]
MQRGTTNDTQNPVSESDELMGSTQKGSRDRHRERHRSDNSWGWEITTLTLSILFFAAQIAILIYMHDKPYYNAWAFSLSLSTVLAILTAGYKASQLHAVGAAIGQTKWIDFTAKPQRLWNFELYDESSRGPQGALEFLFRVPWGLATIGAIITILGLAADAFTQQVIVLETRNITTADNSVLFGYSLEYNTHPNQTALSNFEQPELSTRDPGLQGAIMKGIFNIQTAPEFRCGGACSWNGTYQSLGFSSTCENVTQATSATKVCDNQNNTSISPGNCNMTTPGGVSFSTLYIRTDAATVLRVAVNESFTSNIAINKSVQVGTPRYWRIPPEFLKVAIFRSTSGPDHYFNDPEIIDEEITECTISLALHEYRGMVANGSELTIPTHRRLRLDAGYSVAPAGAIGTNQTVTFNGSEAGAFAPGFSVGVYDWNNMVRFFQSSAFTSHIVAGSDSNGQSQVGIGSAFLRADLPATFDALAESMTDYVRSLGSGPNARAATGDRVDQVIFVRVRWAWLAFPLAVELAALAFVVAVMVKNRRRRIPAWKSSALGLLLHYYSKTDNAIVWTARGPREVESMAKNTTAQLRSERL